jgi:8-oxo-dGTP pyrophosphatase MutT (NUDIX family)
VESVAGIIFSNNRTEVLLIQRRDVPVWVLPGGGIESGESPEEAVLREMEEETGYKVINPRLVGTYTPINKLAKITNLYECTIASGEPSIGDETRNIQFFPLNNLPKLIPPPYPLWIADATPLNPPIIKPLNQVTYTALFKYLITHPILVIRFILARLGTPLNN